MSPARAARKVTELLSEHARWWRSTQPQQVDLNFAPIGAWLERRFHLPSLDTDRHVLPLNGTREGLFAVAQTLVTHGRPGAVICPNPFYQIYEGAALLAGTEPILLNCDASNSFLPDFDSVTDEQWQACQLLFICTPGNPAGAVMPRETLQTLITLAQEHDFVIASDECYSEIYPDEQHPPAGLLEAAAAMGNTDYRHCLCFHSLSKRSNLPACAQASWRGIRTD